MEEVGKSWYTKYRPKSMDDYRGADIKNIVEKRFSKRENMPHVSMIYGNRGCGKTTFARIISKYYLCQDFNGKPCEQCEMCRSINEILIDGESGQVECPGVVEVDATIANGKEAIQEVMDDAMTPPIYSEFKVLIMDECHMFSNAAQNSLLKLIEDIPSHLIVIFATTDPQKVLPTIKSRCQLTLEAKKQSVKDMADRLLEISKLENLTVSRQALETIARKGNRVPRECINLLESMAKTYDGEITIDNLTNYLGEMSADLYMEYFCAANQSLENILVFIKKLKDNSIKTKDFVNGITGFVLDSLNIKHGISLEDYPLDYVKSIKNLFELYTSSDFDMLLQVLENMNNQIEEDNENKNDLMLIVNAMRISKINLLAQGLSNEVNEAITENKISVYEHQKNLKNNSEAAMEAQKIDLGIAEIKEEFSEASRVVSTFDLLKQAEENLPSLDADDTVEEVPVEKVSISSDVDDFLDN